jgi:hypothetical protein
MLSQSRLKELVHYCPDTGVFTWAKSRPACRKGDPCGRISVYGYHEIGIGGRLWRANRLAVLYMTGVLPPDNMDVDHINRDRADNRWSNLRLATRSQNMANVVLKATNSSGVSGVVWDENRKKWRAQLRVNGIKKNLGRFATQEEAAAAVQSAAQEQWGEFWRAA